MNINELIEAGNQARADRNPGAALAYYSQAYGIDPNNAAVLCNLGNVWRECGEPEAAIGFLKRAIKIEPKMETSQFNLAVAYLLAGDYENGWQQYEKRWQYEHLKNTLPNFPQPRWTGQDLKDKTIFIISEQGHGDTIQFVRFAKDLKDRGARVVLHAEPNIAELLKHFPHIDEITTPTDAIPAFDYWSPIMSVAGVLGITLENLPLPLSYIPYDKERYAEWIQTLGPKHKIRVGVCWSGRRDTWINQHKAMPFETILAFIQDNPQYEWVNLQIDASEEEVAQLTAAGVKTFTDQITTFRDTAALLEAMDVVIGVDTAVTHLSGAIGRPTWLLLNQFGQDWRWLLERGDSPWYSSVRIFRQPRMDDWATPLQQVRKFLGYFAV